MARSYLCPHCNAKNRYAPEDANDGVVTCRTCRQPFVLPDGSGAAKNSETAVIDARRVSPPDERPRPPEEVPRPRAANPRAPTMIVSDRAERPAPPESRPPEVRAPSRARTVLLGEGHQAPSRSTSRRAPSTAETQPTEAPRDLQETVPGYDLNLPPAHSWLRSSVVAVTLALTSFGVAIVAFGTNGAADTLTRDAESSAAATANAVVLAMRAGEPDLAVAAVDAAGAVVVRRDGATAFGDRETATRTAVAARACVATAPAAREWLQVEQRRLGVDRCDPAVAPASSKASVSPPFTLPVASPDTWAEGGFLYAAAPVPADASCAPCHGAESAGRSLGTVVVSRPAPRDALTPSALLGATVLLISLVAAAVIATVDARARKVALYGLGRK
ncbi:MAG: hypothetical protein IV100_19450 [Myxococcales bacterium]|nr:hypothetical protein [Myxococcales bacterium]